MHNQLNALAAIAAAQHVGVTPGRGGGRAARIPQRQAAHGSARHRQRHHRLRRLRPPPTAIRTTIDGLRRQVGAQRILAVFEPRSNTMKLGTMKAQLPWSLEQADLSFCHGRTRLGSDGCAPAHGRQGAMGATSRNVATGQLCRAPGDHVLCMSNGGFGGIHAKLLERLAAAATSARASAAGAPSCRCGGSAGRTAAAPSPSPTGRAARWRWNRGLPAGAGPTAAARLALDVMEPTT